MRYYINISDWTSRQCMLPQFADVMYFILYFVSFYFCLVARLSLFYGPILCLSYALSNCLCCVIWALLGCVQ